MLGLSFVQICVRVCMKHLSYFLHVCACVYETFIWRGKYIHTYIHTCIYTRKHNKQGGKSGPENQEQVLEEQSLEDALRETVASARKYKDEVSKELELLREKQDELRKALDAAHRDRDEAFSDSQAMKLELEKLHTFAPAFKKKEERAAHDEIQGMDVQNDQMKSDNDRLQKEVIAVKEDLRQAEELNKTLKTKVYIHTYLHERIQL
jgi:hypothetical protein